MGKVFISHASADKPLIDEFVTLLTTGVGLPLSEIYCTSLDGLGISAGEDIALEVATAINESEVCILILSPNYYASSYCLAEMGAIWIKQKNVLLFKLDTLKKEDPGVFFPGRKVALCDKSGLAQIYDRLKVIKGFSVAKVERWQIRLDLFLTKYSEATKRIKAPSIISISEHKEALDRNNELLALVGDNEAKITEQALLIEELKKAKDKEEVAAVIYRHAGTKSHYEELLAKLKATLSSVPNIVKDVLYSDARGEPFSGDRDQWEEIERAEKRHLIYYSDSERSGYYPNSNHQKVANALTALRELGNLLANSPEFVEELSEQLGYPADLRNKDFWDEITN